MDEPYRFDCGDGWYPILDWAFRKISKVIEGTGFYILIEQVKNKFDLIRIYWSLWTGPTIGESQRVSFGSPAWEVSKEIRKEVSQIIKKAEGLSALFPEEITYLD